MQFLWIIAAALLANQGQAATYALQDDPNYLRLRLEATLPFMMANSIQHQLSLCSQANECLPLFKVESDLTQTRKLNIFRQAEYFSLNRAHAAAIQLGAAPDAPFPELLANFSLKIDSALTGPKVIHGEALIPHLFAAGTNSTKRKQASTTFAKWKMQIPFSQGTQEISLRSEVTILQREGTNTTPAFNSTAVDPAALFQRLKNYQVVFVTGSDGYKAKFFGSEYYDSFQAWLTKNGVQNTRLIPGSNRPIAEQSEALQKFFAAQILENPKPIILVGYSIANSNFMEFLLQHGNSLKENRLVAGWLAINASFLGNPLLEDTYNDLAKRDIALLVSSSQGLEDIRYVNRDAYLDKNYAKILEAVKLIPEVITVSSRVNSAGLISERQARHLELYARGIENDGSTGTFSHFIPGTNYVDLEGTDHELLDKGINGYGADPYAIYLKLFQRILDNPENRSAHEK